MPAQDFDATSVPVDVVAALGLAGSTTFQVQNVSTTATLFIRETSDPVTGASRSFRAEAGGLFTIKVALDPIWMWTDDPSGCPVILDEQA